VEEVGEKISCARSAVVDGSPGDFRASAGRRSPVTLELEFSIMNLCRSFREISIKFGMILQKSADEISSIRSE